MSTFTFAAIVNGDIIGTRTSGTMAYSHAVGFPNDETPSVTTWHLTEQAAVAAARKYGEGAVAVPVTVIKVNGKPGEAQTMPNSDELASVGKARLMAAEVTLEGKMAALDAATITATVDPEGPVLSALVDEVTVEQPVTEVSDAGEAQDVEVPQETQHTADVKAAAKKASGGKKGGKKATAAPAAPKADAAPKTQQVTDRERKQALGRQVHDAVFAAFDGFALPEGITADEAKVIVTKWLSYIPTGTK